MLRIGRILLGLWLGVAGTAAMADMTRLHAAGSLKAAMTEIADAYEAESGADVARVFGPSGLLRQRIEEGEPAQVYASASMRHPLALSSSGLSAPVALFARNRLCALVQPDLSVETDGLLDLILDPEIRLGTSTPGADPAGDYAWAVFDKADLLRPGAGAALKARALQLTGGADSASPPEGRNPYGWVMGSGQADVFLTYCTNAVLAQKDVPGLRIVPLPVALAVGAEYGLTVVKGAPDTAWALALFILSPKGQEILGRYGFEVAGAPAAP